VPEKDLNKVVDDIAISIEQLVNDLERREKRGEILGAKEVREVADQLQTHVANLLSAVARLRQIKKGE
jgi:phage-related minor tail protein